MSTPPIHPSRETIGDRRRTHGCSSDLTYTSWTCMITRCTNPNSQSFAFYGARGVSVCERWRSFANFLSDMGPRPSRQYSLDRIDGSRAYEPGNCRWATHTEQCRNRSTSRAVVRSDGLWFRSMVEAAEATGGNRRCIRDVCTGRQKSHLGYTWRFA